MRILVIDDYRPHGESLTEFLQAKGHEALYAPSFAEAAWSFELFAYDLAVLDFDMPGETGPVVAARLRERFPKIHPIIISAHSPEGQRRMELGDLQFLKKPVVTDALLQMVDQIARDLRGYSLIPHTGFSVIRYR